MFLVSIYFSYHPPLKGTKLQFRTLEGTVYITAFM